MSDQQVAPDLIQPPEHPPMPVDPQVEVAHEALIRNWERLREWAGEDRLVLGLRQELGTAAQQWRDHRQDASYLQHRGNRLAGIEEMHQLGRLRFNRLE